MSTPEDVKEIKTLEDVRKHHEQRALQHAENGAMGWAGFHYDAASAIKRVVEGHQKIVTDLFRRMGHGQLTITSLVGVLQELTEKNAELERQNLALKDELEAEKTCTLALNERLETIEHYNPTGVAFDTADAIEKPEQSNPITDFLFAVREECERARKKHPGTEAMGNALSEETGEVMMALADEPAANVYAECVQVASTAMRIALEGDRAVDFVRARRNLDALPGSPFAAFGEQQDALKTPHELRAAIAQAMYRDMMQFSLNEKSEEAQAFRMSGIAVATLGIHLANNSVETLHPKTV